MEFKVTKDEGMEGVSESFWTDAVKSWNSYKKLNFAYLL